MRTLEFQHNLEWWKYKVRGMGRETTPSLAAIGYSKLYYNRDVSAWTQGCAEFAGSLTVIEPLEHYVSFPSFSYFPHERTAECRSGILRMRICYTIKCIPLYMRCVCGVWCVCCRCAWHTLTRWQKPFHKQLLFEKKICYMTLWFVCAYVCVCVFVHAFGFALRTVGALLS